MLQRLNDSNRRAVSGGTPSVTLLDPQLLNRYTYSRNNPVTYFDPSGHFAFVAALVLGIGVSEVAAAAAIAVVATGAVVFSIWWVQPDNEVRQGLHNSLVQTADDVGNAAKEWVPNGHHTVPREILDNYLPKELADAVRGKKGEPNIWSLPEEIHKQIHKGAGGGLYNERFKEELQKIAEAGRALTKEEILRIRDKLIKEFGLDQYRPAKRSEQEDKGEDEGDS